MIISASRRTDIPAFYAPWLLQRVKAGYCTVPNPFNSLQVRKISLAPEDVEVMVFWTRFPKPLLPHLGALDERGYSYYFQYTLLGYPPEIDHHTPVLEKSLDVFKMLADHVGPQRVIWRYDPIVLTEMTPIAFHLKQFERIARELSGYTQNSVISVLQIYKKIAKRMAALDKADAGLLPFSPRDDAFGGMMRSLVQIAEQFGMQMKSCATELDLRPFGVTKGRCIDDEYLREVFGVKVPGTKDPGQRKACGCVVSRDIGMYDSCLFGCQYCYATKSFSLARSNHGSHNPDSPSLLGWHQASPDEKSGQLTLF